MSTPAIVIPVREDVYIYPLLTQLTECLCTELEASGLAAACRCLLVPGVGPTLDFCDEGCDGSCPGEAWVRMVRAYPSTNFPAQDGAAGCVTLLAFDVEVGVGRCLPTGQTNGQPPDDQEMFDTARLQLADMSAMRRAIVCCFGDSDREYVMGGFEPGLGAGGCLISTWALTVRQAF
jgi:hypothetical protein